MRCHECLINNNKNVFPVCFSDYSSDQVKYYVTMLRKLNIFYV